MIILEQRVQRKYSKMRLQSEIKADIENPNHEIKQYYSYGILKGDSNAASSLVDLIGFISMQKT